MKISILLPFLLFLAILPSQSNAQILWNTHNLELLRDSDQYKVMKEWIIRKAQNYIDKQPISVVTQDKKFAPDPHFYSSIAIYWWPDSTNPSAPYIRKDGQRNPEADQYDGKKIADLRERLKWLSVAYWLTNDNSFKEAYIKQITTWFIDPETMMLPNFEYAQVRPGHNQNKGSVSGLIEAYDFIYIIESIRLMQAKQALSQELIDQTKEWFRQFAQWMTQSQLGQKEQNTKNNHSIAYDVNLLNISLFTQQDSLAKHISDNFAQKRLITQIKDDGTQPEELTRNNAMNYSIYNLNHIIDFCIIQEYLGNNFYMNNQQLIDQAFKWLWQFVGNQQAFPYNEIGNWTTRENYLRRQTYRLNRLKGANINNITQEKAPNLSSANLLD